MRANQKINWAEKLQDSSLNLRASGIYHLIILPMYKEPYEVVRESFWSFKNVNYSKEKLIVVLAVEARAGEAALNYGSKNQKGI